MEINVREARARISELLDIVEQGEEVVITRHGKSSVRLVIAANETTTKSLPDLSDFRASIKVTRAITEILLKERQEARY